VVTQAPESVAVDKPLWWSLTPLVLGAFMVAAEGSVLTGALPLVSADLHASPGVVGQSGAG